MEDGRLNILAVDTSGPVAGCAVMREGAIAYTAALRAGRDVRFALIGAGVYASHGYERSHRKGVENTLRLIEAAVTA